MRFEIGEWTATSGVHIGHHHSSKGQNCQDDVALSAWEHEGVPFLCGIVSDGCGGAHDDLQKIGLSGRSEVGASLLADEALRFLMCSSRDQIHNGLLAGPVSALFQNMMRYIHAALNRCNSPAEEALLIQRYYLATIVGFIMNDEELITFSCGDGVILTRGDKDKTNIIDQDGSPHYLAYACCPLPDKFGITPDVIPEKFDWQRQSINTVNKVMIASDGWNTHNDNKLAAWREAHPDEDLPADLDGQQWGKKGKFGLKKWMNTRALRGYWDDDTAIITVERNDWS